MPSPVTMYNNSKYKKNQNYQTSSWSYICCALNIITHMHYNMINSEYHHNGKFHSLENYFSPHAKEAILKKHVLGMKTSFLNAHVDDVLKSIDNNITKNLNLEKITLAKLKASVKEDPTKMTAINNAITALEATTALNQELDDFQARIQSLQELLKNNSVHNPAVIVQYIKDEYKKGLEAVQQKKQHDLDLVKKTFDTLEGFTDEEKEVIGEEKSVLEKRINEAFEKAETGLKKDFDTDTPDEKDNEGNIKAKGSKCLISLLDAAVKQSESEFLNFYLFSEQTSSKRLAKDTQALTAGVGMPDDEDDSIKFREVKFSEYVQSMPEDDPDQNWFGKMQNHLRFNNKLKTPSGLEIEYKGESMSFNIPSRYWPHYHHAEDNLLVTDMSIVVNHVKANNYSAIVFTLNTSNHLIRDDAMEAFYMAARLAGFKDEDIYFEIGPCSGAVRDEDKKEIRGKASELGGKLSSARAKTSILEEQWRKDQDQINKEKKHSLNNAKKDLAKEIENFRNQNKEDIIGNTSNGGPPSS